MAEFAAPATVEEALAALQAEHSVALGGGTQVVTLLKTGLLDPERVVWLGRIGALAELRVRPDGTLVIGAGVTLDRMSRAPEVRERHPVVADAAARVGNPRVRAVATIGGHLAHADPRQDLPPVLLALGATVVLRSLDGERSLALSELFTGFMATALGDGELITRVEIPAAPPGRRAAYVRFAPGSAADYPTVGVAAALTAGGDVRLAIGAGAAWPRLLPWPDFEPALQVAGDDQRGSAEYKRDMAALFTRRLMAQLLEEA